MELLDGSLSVVTRALLSWSLAELQPFRLERMSLPPTLAYCALPGLPRVVSSALHVVPTLCQFLVDPSHAPRRPPFAARRVDANTTNNINHTTNNNTTTITSTTWH